MRGVIYIFIGHGGGGNICLEHEGEGVICLEHEGEGVICLEHEGGVSSAWNVMVRGHLLGTCK